MNQAALYSIEAEKGVLGSMLLSPRQAIPKCFQAIEVALFLRPSSSKDLLCPYRSLERRQADRPDHTYAGAAG